MSTQFSAYVKFSELNNKKDEIIPFMIIGIDEKDILDKATKYGKEPVIISKLQKLSSSWNTK